MKEIGYWCLVRAGLTLAAARFNRRKILILGYHDVYAGPVDPVDNFDGLRVRLDRFERQMRYVAAHYDVVPLDQLLSPPAGAQRTRPLAAITFDDGYQSICRYVFPVLRRLGLPATVFVITDCLVRRTAPWWERLRAIIGAAQRPAAVVAITGARRSFPLGTAQDRSAALRQLSPELRRVPPAVREKLLAALADDLGTPQRQARCEPLAADELRTMTDGGIAVGSHGCSHDSFLHLDRDALVAELTTSKRILESVTGRPVTWLSYPYGDFSAEAMEAARRAGYWGALTTVPRLYDPTSHPYAIPRVGVDDALSFAHFVVAASGLRDVIKSILRTASVGPSDAVSVPSGLSKSNMP